MPRHAANASFVVLLGLSLANTAAAQTRPTNYDESRVGTYTLPDPLIFNNGKPVRSAQDWKQRRRELLELFATNLYGHTPEPSEQTRFEVTEVDNHALGGKAIRKQITIHFSAKDDGPKEYLLLYLPSSAHKPAPVFLTLNFRGDQAVINDPGVRLHTIWQTRTQTSAPAAETSRGQDEESDVEKVLAHGYGFATIYYQDIEPDFEGGYVHGIRPLFFKPGQTAPAPGDWGAIGAWAYGLSRAMDYLERDKDVDAGRVAIMGHSRLGKTVLWAGAQDTRFAMVIANCPGEGGASLARRDYGETIRDLTERFPYWFTSNLKHYAENPKQLPVDTHELIALIAPRPVYITGAEQDRWADPKGEFLASVAAGPVYRLLGAQDLGTDQMPPLNTPIMRTIGFHIRTGKHTVTEFDWDQFLAFADMHWRAR